MYIFKYITCIYTFLKGWDISQITLSQPASHYHTFSFFADLLSFNLYSYRILHWDRLQIHQPCWWEHLQPRVNKICWLSSRYLFTPALWFLLSVVRRRSCVDRPHLQRRLQVIRLPHRGPHNRVGSKNFPNFLGRERKTMLLFWFNPLSQNWH